MRSLKDESGELRILFRSMKNMHNSQIVKKLPLAVAMAATLATVGAARADSYKKFVNEASGQSLQIGADAAKALGQSAYAAKINQHWNIRAGDGEGYALVSQRDNQAITALEGAQVAARPYTGEENQLWQILPQGGGWNVIRLRSTGRTNEPTGLCLEASPAGIALKSFSGAAPQKWKFTVTRADVYIGGTHPLKYLADKANAKDWSYVAANANGLYTSNVGLHLRSVKGDYFSNDTSNFADFKQLMTQIGAQMKNKNLFYETDSVLTRTPKWDARVITTAMDAGWNVSNVVLWDTEHIGYRANYFPYLRTGWPARPVHIGTGIWVLGGDFADRNYQRNGLALNAQMQDAMLAHNAGSATEGPGSMSVPEDMNGDKNLDSLTSWVKEHLPAVPTESNFSPGDLQPLGFLRQVQRIVKHSEDAGTKPDIWAITYYGPISTINLGPETDSYSYLGVAKWLIQHERDPLKYPAKDWPYFRDGFADLSQWRDTANATTAGGRIVLDGASAPRIRTPNWSPDFQLHILDVILKSGPAGVVFRDQGNGNFYCWEFGDKTLTCKKYVNGVPVTLKSNIATALAVDQRIPNINIEVIGSKIRTYVNRTLVDTTDDSTYTAPGAVGFQTEKGSHVEWGRITIY